MNCARVYSPPDIARPKVGAAAPDPHMLLCEMEHRVKNHLQMLAAYAHLLAKRGDLTAQDVAQDIAEKLWAVAGAHEALHAAGARGDSLALPFLQTLCRPFKGSPHRIEVDCDAALQLPADQLAPLGMIVSEALSNAVRHAFPRGQSGRLQVSLAQEGRELELVVHDDGRGLPAAAAPRSSGRTMIATLARQLGGLAQFQNRPIGGAEVRVVFPARPSEHEAYPA